MARTSSLRAVPVEIRRVSRSSLDAPSTTGRTLAKLACQPAWLAQHYRLVLFQRPPSPGFPWPRWYVIRSTALHRIGGEPGRQIRAGLRLKLARSWRELLRRITKLQTALLLNRSKASDCKHKALPLGDQPPGTRGRPPPGKTNRAAYRRVRKVAWAIVSSLTETCPKLGIRRTRLYGFVARRLLEEHSFDQITLALRHAVDVLPTGAHRPRNRESWLQGVAQRHLESDGLAPIQRKRDRIREFRKRQAARAAAFKIGLQKRRAEEINRECEREKRR